MARTFEEVLRIVLEAQGEQDVEKLNSALGDLGDVSDEVRNQLTGLADAITQATQTQSAADEYRKQGEALRELDGRLREATANVRELDAAEKASAAVLAEKRAALDQAKRVQQSYADGSHALLGTEKQIRDARRQAADTVKQLTAEVKEAERANKADAAALDRQRTALARIAESRRAALESLRAQKAALQAAGVDTAKLASEEKRLAAEAADAEARLRALAKASYDSARAAEQAAERQQKFWSALNRTKVALAASVAGLVGVTRVLGNATRAASDFQTNLAAISTIAPAADMDALAKSVQNLTKQFGGTASTQAKALYEIIAAGIEDTASALKVLETANKLAIGGVANLETAASGLVATINAYGISASDATRISDAFFVSAAAGNTTIEELSQNIGGVASLAKSTGVTIEELAAAIGVLTASGVPTAQAFTQVQSALVAIVKPTDQARKTAQALGTQFDSAALKAQGFASFIANVTEAAAGNEAVLTRLFGRVDGLQGVLSLGSTRADAFAKTLGDMANSAGATERAFQRLADTPAQRLARLQGAVDSVRISFGNLLTALSPLLEGLASAINGFTDLPEPIQATILAITGLLAVAIPLGAAFRALKPALSALLVSLPSLGQAATATAVGVGTLSTAVGTFLRALGPAAIAVGAFVAALESIDAAEDKATEAFGNVIDKATLTAKAISDLSKGFDQGLFDQLLASDPAKVFAELEEQINSTKEAIDALNAIDGILPLGPEKRQELQDYEDRLLALENVQKRLANQAGPALIAIIDRIRSASAAASGEIKENLNKAFEGLGIKSQSELQKAADEAEKFFQTIVDGAKRGEAAQDDVLRAFEAYAKAKRAAVADSTAQAKAEVEATLAAEKAVIELAQAHQSAGAAGKSAAELQIQAMRTLLSNVTATADAIRQNLARAIQDGADPAKIKAFEDALESADKRAAGLSHAINQLQQQTKGIGAAGREAGQELSQGLSGAFDRPGQEANAFKGDIDDVIDALGDATAAGDTAGAQLAQGMIDAAAAAEKAVRGISRVPLEIAAETEKAQAGSAEAAAAVFNGLRESIRVYGDEAIAMFDRVFQAQAGVDRIIETTGLTYAQSLQRVADMANFVKTSIEDSISADERKAASLAFIQQNSEGLAEALHSLGYTVDDLRNGTVNVSVAMAALARQRMDRLRPELEGVADALGGIEDRARGAQEELANLNREYEKSRLRREGDERALAELEFQEELRRIDELADAAGAAGAATAAEARRRAEEEHRARLREIREESEERRRQNNSSGSGSGSSSGGAGGVGSSRTTRPPPEPVRTYRVVLEQPGQQAQPFDLVDERQADALLSVIQRFAAAGRPLSP